MAKGAAGSSGPETAGVDEYLRSVRKERKAHPTRALRPGTAGEESKKPLADYLRDILELSREHEQTPPAWPKAAARLGEVLQLQSRICSLYATKLPKVALKQTGRLQSARSIGSAVVDKIAGEKIAELLLTCAAVPEVSQGVQAAGNIQESNLSHQELAEWAIVVATTVGSSGNLQDPSSAASMTALARLLKRIHSDCRRRQLDVTPPAVLTGLMLAAETLHGMQSSIPIK